MATKLLYMNEFDVVTCEAAVVGIAGAEDGRTVVVLDQTCLYPRGGGQDWDTGVLRSGDAVFVVEEVRLDDEGVVQHIGHFEHGTFTAGQQVHAAADADRRAINTRLHSAGHVVDLAVDRLHLPWTPVRGAHYPHMSFVEYSGELDPAQAETIRTQLEAIAQEVIAVGGENQIRFMPVEEMHTVCRHVPETIPKNKPARVVLYSGNFGIPCGGTHVHNLHDIGTMQITKLKAKKGMIKISYAIEGIH